MIKPPHRMSENYNIKQVKRSVVRNICFLAKYCLTRTVETNTIVEAFTKKESNGLNKP